MSSHVPGPRPTTCHNVCRISSLNCSRFAPEWTSKCEGLGKLAYLDDVCVDGLVSFVFRRARYKHVGMIRLSQVYVGVAGCSEQPRLHSSTAMTKLLALCTATARSLLCSSRRGRAALNPLQQQLLC